VMVVMGEAGEAGHAAGVVVLEPLEEFAQLLLVLLLLLQPQVLLPGWHPDETRTYSTQRLESKNTSFVYLNPCVAFGSI